jgi:glycosyltransferase involved in cell wall biosynthesis
VVFAHLQSAGVIAGVARKLTSFRFFYVRHNTDEHRLQNNKKGIVLNWLANKLSARIIAPSEKVYRYIIEEEKVERSKVVRINYGYDFLQYLETDRSGIAESIRKQFPCRLLVISVARFLPVKRHLLMFEVIRRLVKKKMDIKMICLGDGPNADEMKEFVHTSNMDESIFLLGSKKNVFDYLEAADVFFHLSLSEASNSAVKEAGYCKKPAIVCTNVGDFDDYIKNGINGFIVEKENPVDAAEGILAQLYSDPERLRLLGQNIYQTIVEEFDIRNVKSKYEQILG